MKIMNQTKKKGRRNKVPTSKTQAEAGQGPRPKN
jgi:hypothetical protein